MGIFRFKGLLSISPRDFIKDPYILEFLDIKPHESLYETDLEQLIMDNPQRFILELGQGPLSIFTYFHTKTNIPAKIKPPPIKILGVTGSFKMVNDSKSVMTILALSIEAT